MAMMLGALIIQGINPARSDDQQSDLFWG